MKKVLIITYYWPPAGGPGVQRWLNFVKHLPKQKVHPIVYIPSNPSYPIIDSEINNELPKGIDIISQPIFEPYSWANKLSSSDAKTISKGIIPEQKKQDWKQKLLLWIRGNLFIPDARKFWVKPSVKFLEEYIKTNQIETIITTGPPHSVHLIGLQLKQKLDLRWIADFRDPWTTIGYHKKLKLSRWAKKKHQNLELKVLKKADDLITTSWGTKKEFEAKTKTPITVITNGFEAKNLPEVTLDKEFSLSHIGSLLSERNPINLWKSLSELINENVDFSNDFKLNLAGVVSENIVHSIHKYGLEKHLNLLGYISHSDALQLQRKSQVLLLIEINSEITKAIIPGKLFEYLQSGRPILGIGPKEADFNMIISETQSGSFFNYDEKEFLKSQIVSYYKNFKAGKLLANTKEINQYSREALTASLAKLIHS